MEPKEKKILHSNIIPKPCGNLPYIMQKEEIFRNGLMKLQITGPKNSSKH